MNVPIRTRIAPSPTGNDLHIGNAYTALINYAFAHKHQGKFIVRIEDTDRTRFVDSSEQRIIDSLAWLGILNDEGPNCGGPYAPYRQSERLTIYKKHAEALVANGHAYYCFCTPERLSQMRLSQETNHQPPMYDGHCKSLPLTAAQARVSSGEKYVIRLNVPDEGETKFTDVIRGEIKFENKLIDDQVLLKSDGYPTYHLGVVVDDHIMGISHIIRGEEWISSTPKHILLYQFFDWNLPIFAHMPLLRNPDKSKLSKRKNPVWVSWYREQGYLPEALRNYLSLMAWAHPEGKEIFSTAEFIDKFTLEKVNTSAPVFDPEKLRWLNGEYLRQKTDDELLSLINNFLSSSAQAGDPSAINVNLLKKIIPLIRERMKILSEFQSLAGFFFEAPMEFERKLDTQLVKSLQLALQNAPWNHNSLETTVRALAEKSGLKAKDLFMELRLAVTGKSVGPPLLESLEILGKDETLNRLTNLV